MAKKIISLTALLFFLWFDICCTIYAAKMITPEQAIGKDDKVLAVTIKTGERLEYSGEMPGKLEGDKIIGFYIMPTDVVADVTGFKTINFDKRTQTTTIKTFYDVVTVFPNMLEMKGKIYKILGSSMPLSEINKLIVKRLDNATMNAITIMGLALLPIAIWVIIGSVNAMFGWLRGSKNISARSY